MGMILDIAALLLLGLCVIAVGCLIAVWFVKDDEWQDSVMLAGIWSAALFLVGFVLLICAGA